MDRDGNEGNWDRIHEIPGEYITELSDDYDTIAELTLQVGEEINNPNNSGGAIGFESLAVSLGVDYEAALT